MRSQTRLVVRGSTYYFRARIPTDLRTHFRGKKEIIESLRLSGVGDKRTAERLVRIKSVELDNHFEQIRRDRAAGPLTTISDDAIAYLAAKAVASRMGADEEIRTVGLSIEGLARHSKRLTEAEEAAAAAVARGQFAGLEPMIDDWLQAHGYELQRDSDDWRRFALAFAKMQARVNEKLRRRNRGEPVDTPPMPSEVQGRKHGATMDDLFEYWKQQRAPRSNTCIEAAAIIRRFKDTELDGKRIGNIAPSKVQRRHTLAFRDAMVSQGKAPGTVKKMLSLLGGMFQVAVEDDSKFGVEFNPVRDVKVRGRVGETKARKPFAVEELNAIFSSPIYSEGHRPRGGGGEAAYWLPLIGLYTGARLNEIGQLHTADVKTENNVTFFHFTDEGEGQKLKKGHKSRKRVPVHPELMRLGFLDYLEKMRRQKRGRLFPDLKPNSHGHITGLFSKWFNRYLDGAIGIADRSKDFHSFRHSFKLHARACGIPEDQHDALTGHANATVARTYGSAEGYPLTPLAKAIKRLRFEGLKVQRGAKLKNARGDRGRPRAGART